MLRHARHTIPSLNNDIMIRRLFSSSSGTTIRLSKLLANYSPSNLDLSRRAAERCINGGDVTINGQVVKTNLPVDVREIGSIKVNGKLVKIPRVEEIENDNVSASCSKASATKKVWAVHKLVGELVSHHDPDGRPTLIERLQRGGGSLSKFKHSLKPIGRLDMNTEGLILITNCGHFARQLELPSNALHRTYRARVHGRLTLGKLSAIRRGIEINGVRYRGMDVRIEGHYKKGGTNTWLQIKCTEGKNRQIRKCLEHFGLNVTRLIRTSFGDYSLMTIPPGMAIEVPLKPLSSHKRKGGMQGDDTDNKKSNGRKGAAAMEEDVQPVRWVNMI
mmetsp:Transcript_10317/g.15327  ORF Transcript_10317/g.15327 Transcript_10317/m.15327 type:complete len:332 (-) Transcript_10317:51-1046(-)|eukprot:CAMPEP_0196805516 /NCGR_PEP_ID=MMETSP1362-20130617/5305_1 /TAXON_ID=163516 /ORGANISM="Leptocylindrus danicus, Strain CCMP1856" /LENGTH=331 /DNA_ID=CAMNT_0042178507 /DNA_START=1 /DNA_END=996 /DNA_ORIENTATION=+